MEVNPRCSRANVEAAATNAVTASSSPPVLSASSSPSHEFSFTVSLQSSATTTSTTVTRPKAFSSPSLSAKPPTKASPALAIDLSPADDIFFHGHLLPLQFVSHLHASSSRPSTHSLDRFALPAATAQKSHTSTSSAAGTAAFVEPESSIVPCSSCKEGDCISFHKDHDQANSTRTSSKSKSFLFGLPRWKKGSESITKAKSEGTTTTTENCNKRKLKFEVTQFLKKYLKMVKPLLSANKGGRREDVRFRRQSYSFSGTVSPRDHKGEAFRGMRRGELYSAPASMRTSPTNSGLLLATAGVPSPVSESTMEELQAAIQAAIAHCKNSVSAQGTSQELSSVTVN